MRRAAGFLTACLFAAGVALATPAAAGDNLLRSQKDASVEALLKQLSAEDARARLDAATELAERSDPAIDPALRARLPIEPWSEAKLAIRYALARHGDRASLVALVESAERQSEGLVFVFLDDTAGPFGPVGNGGVKKWRAWVDGVTDEQWREWQRSRSLKWVAEDKSEAGFLKALAWWDTLGYPDVGTLQFVLANTWKPVPAFLLEDGPDRFRVLTARLETMTILKGERPEKASWRTEYGSFEKTDPAEFAVGRARGANPADPFGLRLERTHPAYHILFVVAVSCWKRGAKEAAMQLWRDLSIAHPVGLKAPPWTTLEHMKDAISQEEWRRIKAETAATGRSAVALIASHRDWMRRFGTVEPVRSAAAVLERMAAEEEARKAHPPKAIDAMESDERIDEWVYRLRDVQASSPATSEEEAAEAASWEPYERLVAAGMPAVPRLLRALLDDAFSKSWRDSRSNNGWPHWAYDGRGLRVADHALCALREITGEDFSGENRDRYYSNTAWRSIIDEGKAAAIRARAEAWWKRFKEGGEKSSLVEGVSRGDAGAVELGRRLLARYPEAAPAAIIAGIRAIRADEYRSENRRDALIALLGHARGSEALPFLRAELTGNASAHRLVETALALDSLGDPAGVEAIRSLAKNADPSPVRGRFEALEALALAAGQRRFDEWKDAQPPEPLPEALSAAVEEALVAFLPDETPEGYRTWGGKGGMEGYERHVGNEAALILAALRPDLYSYDETASRAVRVKRRVEFANAWRKRHEK